MNFSFRIELYEDGEGEYASLFSFYVGDRAEDELTRFLSNDEHQNAPDFDPLILRLERSIDELGLYHSQSDFGGHRFYRDEGEDTSALWAPIPVEDWRRLREPYPSLRLYCFRLEHILVAGYGGIKTTRRTHEDPNLQESLRQIKHVRRRLNERIEEGSVRLVEGGFLLDGELYFDPQTTR